MIETPSELGVRLKIAPIAVRLKPDVLVKSFGNLWQGSVNLGSCKVDGHVSMV
jgi:hypothetical protein